MIDSTPGEVQSLFPETLPPIFQTFILFNQLNRNPMRQDKVWTVSQAGSQRRSTPERLLATQVEPLDGKKKMKTHGPALRGRDVRRNIGRH